MKSDLNLISLLSINIIALVFLFTFPVYEQKTDQIETKKEGPEEILNQSTNSANFSKKEQKPLLTILKEISGIFLFILQLYLLPFLTLAALFKQLRNILPLFTDTMRDYSRPHIFKLSLSLGLLVFSILPWLTFTVNFSRMETIHASGTYSYLFILLSLIYVLMQLSENGWTNYPRSAILSFLLIFFLLSLLWPQTFLTGLRGDQYYSLSVFFYLYGFLLIILEIWEILFLAVSKK